jgi:glyoxylase-like metal-dependent hydrolase (beta-lactamase superfamily II)
MRILTLFSTLLLTLLFTLVASAESLAGEPATVDMELRQVSRHVYYVQGAAGVATDNQGFISNAAVVVTGAGVVVFDALGTPALGRMLLEKIRAVTSEPIVSVIVSHYHADHIYGLQVFADLEAQILAPAGAADYLNAPEAEARLAERRTSLFPWVDEHTRLVWPDRYIRAPESFRLGDVEFVITTLGAAHSDGDLTLYVKPDRVLLSGDVIFEGRVPFVGDANTANWLAVLEQMASSQPAALIPGHGPLARDPLQAITGTRDYLAFLRAQMGHAVEDFTPFDEAYDAVDWSRFAHLPAFEEANRRNAYQVYLSLEAELLAR